MKNPVASNAESIAAGKSLYATHCKSCHGSKGLGDGCKAAQLKTEPGDFASADFQSQTDGSYFIRHLKDGMICQALKRKFPTMMIDGAL